MHIYIFYYKKCNVFTNKKRLILLKNILKIQQKKFGLGVKNIP